MTEERFLEVSQLRTLINRKEKVLECIDRCLKDAKFSAEIDRNNNSRNIVKVTVEYITDDCYTNRESAEIELIDAYPYIHMLRENVERSLNNLKKEYQNLEKKWWEIWKTKE